MSLYYRPVLTAALVALMIGCTMGVLSAPALASAEGVGWEATSRSLPTNLVPGHRGTIEVSVFNIGAVSSSGTITVTDTLPPGVTATDAGELAGGSYFGGDIFPEEPIIGHSLWDCSGVTVVTCTSDSAGLPSFAGGGDLPVTGLAPGGIGIAVDVAPGAQEGRAVNRVSVGGGGAVGTASSANSVTIGSTPADFGIAGWDGWLNNSDGTLDTQAGSHPYAAYFNIDLPISLDSAGHRVPAGGRESRSIAVSLPPGLIGDPGVLPQCTRQELISTSCPGGSQVGRAYPETSQGVTFTFGLYNMVPPPGVPAELGGVVFGIQTYFNVAVRSGSDYGVTTHVNNIVQPPGQAVETTMVALWGVPGEDSHNFWRTSSREGCTEEYKNAPASPTECRPPDGAPRAFLTLPVACEGPLAFSIFTNAWQDTAITDEASFLSHDANGVETGMDGCDRLPPFIPSLSAAPDTSRANTPTGFTTDVHFPLEGLTDPEGIVPPDMRDATVTLPEGLVVNPGQATGLVACQETEATLSRNPDGTENTGPAVCPAASRIGTAKVKTPLLEADEEKELEGGVYVLQSNPPDIKLLIAASADGVNVKQVGTVHLDEATGRLTAVFKNVPQQPVSDIKLSFNGGPQAALTTPRSCGVFTTSSDLVPWSTPFTPDATPSSQFAINEGVGGGGCPGGEPFAPVMVGGMVNNQAGAFSPLSVTLTRQDQEQDGSAISLTTPPGLLAILKSVVQCPEPQAAQGACGAGSLIGHVTADVGAGPDPFRVQGGRVYLTGPYKGAPFGLSVVVPAVAGPFNLGNVIVRAGIYIDPHTAQPTIVSDPLPRILDGVPLQIQKINVTVDREGFMFNPTNCEPLAVTGTVTSTHGAVAPVSSRFQAANCANLAFKPSFKVSTQAKTSKKSGASLDVKVGSGAGQANIGKVAVSLPKQLPSRLTTIQQACPEATFNANPASCPAGSSIGIATARTPVLASPASGPAYLVSHGGAAFPDLVIILQDEGVTLDLVGSINIKKGVTSSAFNSVPDVPISSFELSLPEGPHSGLAAVLPAKARGSLCGTSLVMPTTLTGQNGAVVKQSTKIAVTGCPRAKKKSKAKKHTKASQRTHGKKGGKK